jgi:hypothetical protein
LTSFHDGHAENFSLTYLTVYTHFAPDNLSFPLYLFCTSTGFWQVAARPSGNSAAVSKGKPMGLVLLSLVLYGVLASGNLYAANSKPNIGLNLSGITDHASQWVYTNAFRASRPWTGEKTGVIGYYQHQLDTDGSGWVKSLKPGETAFSLMFTEIGKKYPGGEYLLTYDGEGSLQFKWNVFVRRQGNGYFVLDVQPDDAGIEVRLTETNPNNPIRNIRLMMPGYWERNETDPFHPLFLEKIKPFSIYRFMD